MLKDNMKDNTVWVTRDKEGPDDCEVCLWLTMHPMTRPEKRNGIYGNKANIICKMHFWHFKNLFGFVPRKGTIHKREMLTAIGCKIMEFNK